MTSMRNTARKKLVNSTTLVLSGDPILVAAIHYALPPIHVAQVPGQRTAQPSASDTVTLKPSSRSDLATVDGIAPIVAGAGGHELDQGGGTRRAPQRWTPTRTHHAAPAAPQSPGPRDHTTGARAADFRFQRAHRYYRPHLPRRARGSDRYPGNDRSTYSQSRILRPSP